MLAERLAFCLEFPLFLKVSNGVDQLIVEDNMSQVKLMADRNVCGAEQS